RVERVQIQPLVLERPPPRFDERIGEGDLGQGQQALQQSRIDQALDRAVAILDAGVGQQSRLSPLRPLRARCRSTAVTPGSKVADTGEAGMGREKLSMRACR